MAASRRKIESTTSTDRARNRLSLGSLISGRWKKGADDSERIQQRPQQPRHIPSSSVPVCMPLPSPASPSTPRRSFESTFSVHSRASLVEKTDDLYSTPISLSSSLPVTPSTPILKCPMPILTRAHSLNSSPGSLRWDHTSSPLSTRSGSSQRSLDRCAPLTSTRFPLRASSLVTEILHERDEDDALLAARTAAHKRHNSAPLPSESSSCPSSTNTTPSSERTSPRPCTKVWLCSRPAGSQTGKRDPLPRPVVHTEVVRGACDRSSIELMAAHRIPTKPPFLRNQSSDTTMAQCGFRTWSGTSPSPRSAFVEQHLFPGNPRSSSPVSSIEGHSYEAAYDTPYATPSPMSGIETKMEGMRW